MPHLTKDPGGGGWHVHSGIANPNLAPA
jgi:hypothetical protein